MICQSNQMALSVWSVSVKVLPNNQDRSHVCVHNAETLNLRTQKLEHESKNGIKMENKFILKQIHFTEKQSVWLRNKNYMQISDTFFALQICSR